MLKSHFNRKPQKNSKKFVKDSHNLHHVVITLMLNKCDQDTAVDKN